MKTIVFTGGGTAGHIMPNIALIEKLRDYKIYYLGSDGMEKRILKAYPKVSFITIPVVKFVRSLTPKNLLIPFKLTNSIHTCKRILQEIKPDVIFSKGGYVSIPVCIAGNKLNIPVITHESDLSVGLANKIIGRKAKHVCCSFEDTAVKFGKNAIFTGTPIRNSILHGDKKIVYKRHRIIANKPVILIVGGSLGALSVNKCIWENIDKLTSKYIVLHIVGKNNLNKELSTIKDYFQIEFADDIQNYFDASNVVISRAGSNTIFELLELNKPMILIPLSKSASRGDQILNAQKFENLKYAEVILQEDLNGDVLLDKINSTLKNSNIFVNNMRKSKYINGTEKIIDIIKKF